MTEPTQWRPISEADPKNGDIALIIAEDTAGNGETFLRGPQLCVYEHWEDDETGGWFQMLRGVFYGLGLDGEAKFWIPVSEP